MGIKIIGFECPFKTDVVIEIADDKITLQQHGCHIEIQITDTDIAVVDVGNDITLQSHADRFGHAVIQKQEIQFETKGPALEVGVTTLQVQIIDTVTRTPGKILEIDAGTGNADTVEGDSDNFIVGVIITASDCRFAGCLPVSNRIIHIPDGAAIYIHVIIDVQIIGQ